jgi:hypothetical protein
MRLSLQQRVGRKSAASSAPSVASPFDHLAMPLRRGKAASFPQLIDPHHHHQQRGAAIE